MISEWIAAILLVLGALFMLIASIGVLKMTDVYQRMHAVTKAPSLGAFLMILSMIIYFQDFWLTVQGILINIFVFMTTPVGTHMLGRVAHLMHVELGADEVIDELEETDRFLETLPKDVED
jgi:multicomponent Na+:H+ antiporter subunit G